MRRQLLAGVSTLGLLSGLVACSGEDLDADDTATETVSGALYYGSSLGQSLANDQVLSSRQSLTNNGYELIMQHDCNLVLYDWKDSSGCNTSNHSRVLWSSKTNNKGSTDSCFALMQTDGNLVIYTTGSKALWESNTFGDHNVRLDMQADGNAVLYRNATAIWATNTDVNRGGRPRTCKPSTTGRLSPTLWSDAHSGVPCGETKFVATVVGGTMTSPFVSGRPAGGGQPGFTRCRYDYSWPSVPVGNVRVCATRGTLPCANGTVRGGVEEVVNIR